MAPHRSNQSELSYATSHHTSPSERSYATTRTSRSGRVRGKVQVASNPLCPRIRGLCYLMILFNLALILICLGFTLVLQFFEPGYVWYLGIFMLVFGFVTLICSFVYCVIICQEHKSRQEELDEKYVNGEPPPLYWNREWKGSTEFGSASEINYDNKSGRIVNPRENGHSQHHPSYYDQERY